MQMADEEISLQFDYPLLVGREGRVLLEHPAGTRVTYIAALRAEEGAENSGVGVEQDVTEGGAGWGFDLDHAEPAGGVVGGGEFGEAVVVAGAAGEVAV